MTSDIARSQKSSVEEGNDCLVDSMDGTADFNIKVINFWSHRNGCATSCAPGELMPGMLRLVESPVVVVMVPPSVKKKMCVGVDFEGAHPYHGCLDIRKQCASSNLHECVGLAVNALQVQISQSVCQAGGWTTQMHRL